MSIDGESSAGEKNSNAGKSRVVVLSAARTKIERDLLDRWCRSDDVPADYRASGSPDVLDLDSRVLTSALSDRTDDPLLLPVRVVWLPSERDGARRARFSDVLALTNPRNPNVLIQKWLVGRSSDRYRIVVAAPAHLDDLREQLEAEEHGRIPDAASLARYVTRRAVVALERSERAVIGDRYKVPRLVAAQIMDQPSFRRRLDTIATEEHLSRDEVDTRARDALDELVAVQSRLVTDLFTQAMRPLHTSAWTVHADDSGLEALRELNRTHPLVFLPSHRSYADAFVLGGILADHDFPGNHLMGGANLTFWPIGPIARRTGTVFIRRSFGNDTVYKAALEEYFAFLLSKRFNLEWYFEGGRTRTGKLRRPRYGLLNYVANAIRSGRVDDAMLVPVSITYEGLAEVAAVAAEQTGAAKKPEGLRWLANYARNQQRSAGNVYVQFGTPLSMRAQLAAGGDPDLSDPAVPEGAAAPDPMDRESLQRKAMQKVAFEVAGGINRTTPVTVNSLVTLALLGVRDRALTLDEVRAVVAPVRSYLDARDAPQGEVQLLDREGGLAPVLAALTDAGVVTTYSGGDEAVYSIQPGQHLVAAFYRNSGIHWFVNRSILELAVLFVHEHPSDNPVLTAWYEAKKLRDLLKFEFFFPDRDTFESELRAEVELLVPEWEWGTPLPTEGRALNALVETGLFMSHRTLRSFFDAQLVVAERLARRDPTLEVERDAFLDECVAVGRQMLLQGRLHGSESVSSELFATALELARNRGLLDRDDDSVAQKRREFASQLLAVGERVALAESLDVSNRKAER
jgi:glycerol-3-phosphate O-acyltransferase